MHSQGVIWKKRSAEKYKRNPESRKKTSKINYVKNAELIIRRDKKKQYDVNSEVRKPRKKTSKINYVKNAELIIRKRKEQTQNSEVSKQTQKKHCDRMKENKKRAQKEHCIKNLFGKRVLCQR